MGKFDIDVTEYKDALIWEMAGYNYFHSLFDGSSLKSFGKYFVSFTDLIMIASMTRPDFIIAIKRAVAIVTDEGGVACHASIIAREMNKPCIIGTKIATKAIKDGDLIEVDAEKGIVKVIEKANN